MNGIMERLYKSEYPSVDDIVVVQITEMGDLGAKCKLLEYGGVDGFVPISEFSKRGRIKSMKQVFQIGSIYPLHVINVEPTKGVIDLSKKHITSDEGTLCLKKYKEAKIADSILRRTAELCSVPKIIIYQNCIWPLCFRFETVNQNDDNVVEMDIEMNKTNEDEDRKPASSLEVLHHLFRQPSLMEMYALDIDASIKSVLMDILQTKLKPTLRKVSSVVTLTCFGAGGINSIKSVLKSTVDFANLLQVEFNTNSSLEKKDNEEKAEEDGDEKNNEYCLKLYTIGCPDYELSVESKDVNKAISFLNKIIEKMHTDMNSVPGGRITVKTRPNIV